MTVLSKIKSHPDAVDYFKELQKQIKHLECMQCRTMLK